MSSVSQLLVVELFISTAKRSLGGGWKTAIIATKAVVARSRVVIGHSAS
jgi:hypothetical protein